MRRLALACDKQRSYAAPAVTRCRMSIADPTFSTQQIAEAAGMTSANFRQYLSRGHWRIVGNAQPAESAGKGHLFTINDALGYALAARLVQRGVDAKVAFESAMFDFALSSNQMDRKPGEVFDPRMGRTWFILNPAAPKGRILLVGPDNTAAEVFANSSAVEMVIIDLTDLRDTVFHSLGLDARDYENWG